MTDDPTIDPHRLLIAAHELGHALTWHALGFTVDEIWIKGHGRSAHGYVWLDITKAKPWTVRHERDYHIGLFGGREAQQRWCEDHNIPFDEYACAEDMAIHRKRRRTRLGGQVHPGEAKAEARRLVRAHWRRIVHLAPSLATRGSLSPSRI